MIHSSKFFSREDRKLITVLSPLTEDELKSKRNLVYLIQPDNGLPYIGSCYKQSIHKRLEGHFNTPYYEDVSKSDKNLLEHTENTITLQILDEDASSKEDLVNKESILISQYVFDNVKTLNGFPKTELKHIAFDKILSYPEAERIILNKKIDRQGMVRMASEKIRSGEYSKFFKKTI